MVILTPFPPPLQNVMNLGDFFPPKKSLLEVPTLWFLFAKSVLREKTAASPKNLSQKLQ